MITNDELECKLLRIFSHFTGKPNDDGLIEQVKGNSLPIRETEESGKCAVCFENARFTTFHKIERLDFLFKRAKGEVLLRRCDGIFLGYIEGKLYLCLVELKKTISCGNFKDAIEQIEAGYLKTAMFLSLLFGADEIDAVCFIGGWFGKDNRRSRHRFRGEGGGVQGE